MAIKILRIKFTFLTLVIIALISAINLSLLYLFIPGPLEETKTLIVESGLSSAEIASKLRGNEVINHKRIFWLVAKLYSLNSPLKSGEYKFTPGISPFQVLNILVEGKSVIHKLIIPEGLMVSEIVAKINAEDRLFGEIKGDIPEGYLMPSTYFYSYGDQKEQLIEQMRRGMSAALDEAFDPMTAQIFPLKSRLDVLILASIVEKEASLDSERPIIAGVFLNRLRKGMKLQADPTSIYAITEGKFALQRPLTKKDLAFASPYNTYYVAGLPPGAICCPGLKSLQAVVRPAKTKALFFVVNGQGGHNFSSTLGDHNKHVESYKKKQVNAPVKPSE